MPYIIDQIDQIKALASPIRQDILEIVDLMGPCDAKTIAQSLGHPQDGLYYHIKQMLGVGLLKTTEDEDSRSELYVTQGDGKDHTIRYNLADRENVKAIIRVARGLAKISLSDFEKGMQLGEAETDGPHRTLLAARFKGWLNDDELSEMNSLLDRIQQLFTQKSSTDRQHLHSLTVISAPCEHRPPVRGASPD